MSKLSLNYRYARDHFSTGYVKPNIQLVISGIKNLQDAIREEEEKNKAGKNHNSCGYCQKTGHKTKNCPDIVKSVKFKDKATKARPAPIKLKSKEEY